MKKVRLYKNADHLKKKYKFDLEEFVLYDKLMKKEYAFIHGGNSFEFKYSHGLNYIILNFENDRVVGYELGMEMNGD